MRALTLSIIVALATAGCANKGASQIYTGAVSYGAAYGPSGTDGGTTTSVKIRDRGGFLTKAVLIVAIALGNVKLSQEAGTTSVSYNETCTETMCTTYKTYDHKPGAYKAEKLTPEEAAKAEKAMQSVVDADLTELETTLEIASDALGGDTSGALLTMEARGAPHSIGPFDVVTFGGGLSLGQMKFRGRTTHELTRPGVAGPNDTMLEYTETPQDYNYNVFAFPLRVDIYLGRATIFGRIDLNTFTLLEEFTGERESPSPWHVGSTYRLGPLFMAGQVTFVEMQLGAMTYTGEVGFAF